MRQTFPIIITALTVLLARAAAATDGSSAVPLPGSADSAPLKTHNQQIVAQTPGSDGVFAVQEDGSIKHLQSGLICPAHYPNVEFYHVFVYARDGSDVGCDYRRADDKGGASSKLSIFATRSPTGTTLDQAFRRYHNEVLQVSPNAKSQGPALQGAAPKSLPEIRSEQFIEPLNDVTYTSQLFVSIVSGWVIEVRATFVGFPNSIQMTKEGGVGAVELETGDRVMGPKALMDALGTIRR